MIARMTRGSNVSGMVHYNHRKTLKNSKKTSDQPKENLKEAELIGVNAILITEDSKSTAKRIVETISLYNDKNTARATPNLHISLNFHKNDILTNPEMLVLAKDYMKRMHLANQPFAIYRHFDREHPHMHIVTTRINQKGTYISDSLEYTKSVEATQAIEKKYGLTIAKESVSKKVLNIEKSIDNYHKGKQNLNAILNDVNKDIIENKRPVSIKEYDKLLNGYDIVRRESIAPDKTTKLGHTFYLTNRDEAIDVNSEPKISSDTKGIKGSDLADNYSLNLIEQAIEFNKKEKEFHKKNIMGRLYSITNAIGKPIFLEDFDTLLKRKGIALTVFRKQSGDEIGQIYGVSFTDMKTKLTYKGSELKMNWKTLEPKVIDDNFTKTVTKDKYIPLTQEISVAKAKDITIEPTLEQVDTKLLENSFTKLDFIPEQQFRTLLPKKKKKKKRKPKRGL